jgi:polysaccharide biosynthesis transport protein
VSPNPMTPAETQQTFDLRRSIAGIRRRAWLVLSCVVVTTAAAWAFSAAAEKQYSATASLLFRDPGFRQILGAPSGSGQEDPEREAATNVRLVSLGVVADRTAAAIGGELTGDVVEEKIEIEPEGQSDIVSVTATDPDPEFAARLANEFAQSYVSFRSNAERSRIAEARRLVEEDFNRLTPQEQASDQGREIQDELARLGTLGALDPAGVEVAEPASIPDKPSSPKTTRNIVGGALLGLVFGLGLALLLERFDRRLKGTAEFEESFSWPILASVPQSRAIAKAAAIDGPDSDGPVLYPLPAIEQETFRMLHTRLRYFDAGREIHSVVVTSASSGEGTSTVAFQLAAAAATAGSDVMLVEADLHHPLISRKHDLPPTPGLVEVLTDQSLLAAAIHRIPVVNRSNGGPSASRELHVIVAGTAPVNPVELIEGEQMATLVSGLMRRYDLVVIDTPATLVSADAIPLMKLVDGVIVVGRVGKTTRQEAVYLQRQLNKLGAPVLGVVVNQAGRGPESFVAG